MLLFAIPISIGEWMHRTRIANPRVPDAFHSMIYKFCLIDPHSDFICGTRNEYYFKKTHWFNERKVGERFWIERREIRFRFACISQTVTVHRGLSIVLLERPSILGEGAISVLQSLEYNNNVLVISNYDAESDG